MLDSDVMSMYRVLMLCVDVVLLSSFGGVVVADRSRGVLGRASRGVVAEIDEQLAALDGELSPYDGSVG